MLTENQSRLIRIRFHACPNWEEIKELFPDLDQALNALPDEVLINRQGAHFREMYQDAKAQVLRPPPEWS